MSHKKQTSEVEQIEELYFAFRHEIDQNVFPLAVKESHKENSTMRLLKTKQKDGSIVTAGFLFVRCGYVDSIYVIPKYRRQGIATKAIRDFLNEGGTIKALTIVKGNIEAITFWNSVFKLSFINGDDVESNFSVIGINEKFLSNKEANK